MGVAARLAESRLFHAPCQERLSSGWADEQAFPAEAELRECSGTLRSADRGSLADAKPHGISKVGSLTAAVISTKTGRPTPVRWRTRQFLPANTEGTIPRAKCRVASSRCACAARSHKEVARVESAFRLNILMLMTRG